MQMSGQAGTIRYMAEFLRKNAQLVGPAFAWPMGQVDACKGRTASMQLELLIPSASAKAETAKGEDYVCCLVPVSSCRVSGGSQPACFCSQHHGQEHVPRPRFAMSPMLRCNIHMLLSV